MWFQIDMKITAGIVDTPEVTPIVNEVSPITLTPTEMPGAVSEQQQKKS
mgnify:CR=1 FL=1